jgi:hypothetical protein
MILTHVVDEKLPMDPPKMVPCTDTLLPVCSHTTFNAIVATFHFLNVKTVVPGQLSEWAILAAAVVAKTMVALFSTKTGLMPTDALLVTALSHGTISEIEDRLKKMFST